MVMNSRLYTRLLVGFTTCALLLGSSSLQASELSPSRQLRRLMLTLLDTEPGVADYEALLAIEESGRAAYLDAKITEFMDDPRYAQTLQQWGREYLATGDYTFGERFTLGLGIQLHRCAQDTTHAGALSWSYHETAGESLNWCNSPGVTQTTIMPWWDPTTPITVLGTIGGEHTRALTPTGAITDDCAEPNGNKLYNVTVGNTSCSCGPALIYCADPNVDHEDRYARVGQVRAAFEEPSRLFAHIITQERSFADLILGDYTLVNRSLYHMYLRGAQYNMVGEASRLSQREMLDTSTWWRRFNDPDVWQEVRFSEMDPHYLDARDYTFDPRIQMGEPEGLPSAGVLTTLVAQRTYERERVRAARWLERLTCRTFSPPDASVRFNTFVSEPAKEGTCQHCHTTIDPAAIHFKRPLAITGSNTSRGILGIGRYRVARMQSWGETRQRVESSFNYDTVLTPVTPQQGMMNPDALLIDFLPPDQTLFREVSDGTIGPLGFGKLLVQSGKFDECAVQRAYERFGGRVLEPGADQPLIQELTEMFVQDGRNMNALIRHIMTRPETSQGL